MAGRIEKPNKALQMRKMLSSWRAATIVICGLVLLAGAFMSIKFYDDNLGGGDQSTFYAFASNIAKGEVIYKDFVHFRTPGSYFLWSLFIRIFGMHQNSLTLALYAEALIFYPLVFALSVMIILKALKKKQAFWYGGFAVGLTMLIPPFGQLRAGLAFLAVALYIRSLELVDIKQRALKLAGVTAGVTFIFGQEMAAIAAVTMVANEVVWRSSWTGLIKRLQAIVGGALAGAAPLLLYILFYSSFGAFVYYTTYYAMVRQPKFMDLPFPSFSYSAIVYYLPFILYGLCFGILYFNQKLGKEEGVILGFGILRLTTLLGRSDAGHLYFSIPELFLIVPLFLLSCRGVQINKKALHAFAPYGVAFFGALLLAIFSKSAFLVLIPFVIAVAVKNRPEYQSTDIDRSGRVAVNSYLILGATFTVLIYILTPSMIATINSVRAQLHDGRSAEPKIGGVQVSPSLYAEYYDVKEVTDRLQPRTLFSFPIQPIYYSLAPKHATKLLTFEPQVTEAEQDSTIQQLQETKPQIIVFDVLQAEALSGAVWRISNYITTNYQVTKTIVHDATLWVMVPKDKPSLEIYPRFNMYRSGKQATVSGLDYRQAGISNALLVDRKATIKLENTNSDSLLSVRIRQDASIQQLGACGIVVLRTERQQEERRICASDDLVNIKVSSAKHLDVTFEENEPGQVLFDNPVLRAR